MRVEAGSTISSIEFTYTLEDPATSRMDGGAVQIQLPPGWEFSDDADLLLSSPFPGADGSWDERLATFQSNLNLGESPARRALVEEQAIGL